MSKKQNLNGQKGIILFFFFVPSELLDTEMDIAHVTSQVLG